MRVARHRECSSESTQTINPRVQHTAGGRLNGCKAQARCTDNAGRTRAEGGSEGGTERGREGKGRDAGTTADGAQEAGRRAAPTQVKSSHVTSRCASWLAVRQWSQRPRALRQKRQAWGGKKKMLLMSTPPTLPTIMAPRPMPPLTLQEASEAGEATSPPPLPSVCRRQRMGSAAAAVASP